MDYQAERERREDYRFGLIASILASAHRDSKQHPDGFMPADFFRSLRTADIKSMSAPAKGLALPKSKERMRAEAIALVKSLGGTVKL